MADGGDRGELLVPLAALGRGDIDVCGGKAANLGELIRAGFPVPDGFVVTTEAYQRVAAGASLGALHDAIRDAPKDDVERLDRLAADARRLLTEAPIPEEVARAIAAAYSELGADAPVAVRSSATAEDLPDASFAGQQDTYLHIRGRTALLDAVRRCWASLWTDRAVAYRAKNGIDPRAVRLAVVVQQMVRAKVAGVMFTADPVSGKRRRAVIDASPGLGEAVVSGAVNPDHFEVDTETGTIVTRHLGDKKVVIEPLPEGGTRRIDRASGADRACLSDEEILALAALGAKVEAYYGAPQDTEWALDAERRIQLVQSRPITTLFPLPSRAPSTNAEAHVYLNFNVAQGVFQPFTPMGIQVWRLVTAQIATFAGFPYEDPEKGPNQMSDAGGRLFVDLTDVVRSDIGREALSFAFQRMEARSAAMLDTLFADPRFSVQRTSRWQLLKRFAKIVKNTRIPLTAVRYMVSPDDVPRRARAAGDRALAKGHVRDGASPEERIDAAKRLLSEGPPELIPVVVPALVAGMLSWRGANKLLADVATPQEMETTFRGLPHNPTTEMDLALWKVAVRLRDDPESVEALRNTAPDHLAAMYLTGNVPAALLQELKAFLAEYGFRGVAEIDLGVPRWRDDPTHVLGVLANYVAHPDEGEPPDQQFARIEREAESMVTELVRRAEERDPARADVAAFLLSRMRALAGLREAPKFYFMRVFGAARAHLVEVGRALTESGSLSAEEDVFMLDLAEAREALRGRDFKPIVTARRAALLRERGRRSLPRIYLSDGTEPAPAGETKEPEGQLRGTPASTGQVTSKARVVLDPNGAKLERGEILVAPSTDPGWTPLFLTAGGLVMEMGGSMSHGAVVAREYGIPAVVGVPDATTRIRTGDTLFVDGAAGIVRIVPADKE